MLKIQESSNSSLIQLFCFNQRQSHSEEPDSMMQSEQSCDYHSVESISYGNYVKCIMIVQSSICLLGESVIWLAESNFLSVNTEETPIHIRIFQ